MSNYEPYSHSKIQLGYCPYAFKRRYIDKDEGIQRGNALFGQVAHAIIADLIKAQVDGRPYIIEDLYEKHVPHVLLPRMGELQGIVGLFDRFTMNPKDVLGIEEKVAIDLLGNEAPWDASYLRGIIDLIEVKDKHATVTDHKTQFNILNKEEMDKNEQLTFYCFLAKALYPQLETFTVRIYFARYGIFRTSKRNQVDLDKCIQSMDLKIKAIESIEEWVPIAGQNCGFCSYIHECPLAQYDEAGHDLPAVMNDEQAIRWGRLLQVRKAQIKHIEEQLKAYCSEYGSVEISGDYAFGFKPVNYTSWPTKQTLEILDRHGQDFKDHMTFSGVSLNKLTAQARRLDEDLYGDLIAVQKKEVKTQFKGYKC